MQPSLAHIAPPSSVPGWAPWLAALVMYGSAIALLLARRGRRFLLAAGVFGLGGTAAVLALSPTVPAAPGYAISLALPGGGERTSPLLVSVCGRRPDGSGAAVPGAGNLLTVFLDGRQVLETRRTPVAVEAPAGAHLLRVEVLTDDHREFRPPLDSRLALRVAGAGPLPSAAACPHG
ncbi:MAG TPA: hypothetical protein VH134_05430 [Candidatus Dormibacteraeota bacterium]|nr:hypothetical protein [Candidatus Dormibacteraeota bacterium]